MLDMALRSALCAMTHIMACWVQAMVQPVRADASQYWGRFSADNPLRGRVVRGSASCASARAVVRDFIGGKGVGHGDETDAGTYYTVRGWRCFSGADGGGCCRRGSSRASARIW